MRSLSFKRKAPNRKTFKLTLFFGSCLHAVRYNIYNPFANWVFDRPSSGRRATLGSWQRLQRTLPVLVGAFSTKLTETLYRLNYSRNKMYIRFFSANQACVVCGIAPRPIKSRAFVIAKHPRARFGCIVFSHAIRSQLIIYAFWLSVCSQEVLEARIVELEDSLQRLQKRVTQQQQVSYLSARIPTLAQNDSMRIEVEARPPCSQYV